MGMIFAFSSALLYSISNVLVKKGIDASQADNGVQITTLVNTIILLLVTIIYWLSIETTIPINLTGVLLFMLAGLLSTFLGRYLFFTGISKIGSSRATALKKSSPLFTLIFALVFLHEVFGLWPLIGIGLILFGLFIQGVQLFRGQQATRGQLGYIIALGAAISFGLGTVVRKQAILYYHDAFIGALIGSLTALVFISVVERRQTNLFSSIKRYIREGNFYYLVAGVASSIGLLSSFLALVYIQATYLSAILALESVLTVLISKLFLNQEEHLSLMMILSACVICFGAGLIALTA